MTSRLSPLVPIDLQEALKDSPRFRQSLVDHTAHLVKLEQRLNEILKLVSVMNELGQAYVANFYKLSICVNQLNEEIFNGNGLASSALNSISEAYAQTVHLSRGLFDNSTLQLVSKLSSFIKTDLHKVNECRAHFDQMSSSMDEALVRNAGCSRMKPAEGAEGRNALTAVGTAFAHTTLDYVAQMKRSAGHANHVVVDGLWTLVKEYSSFFARGHAFFDEWTAEEKGAIADCVSSLSAAAKLTDRKMQDIHSNVNKETLSNPSGMSPDPDVVMEGYLYKRSSNALRKWNRRWFQIRDSKLLYCHRSCDQEEPTVMEENLMLCLVKPASTSVDRPACFELVTPTRSHLLQADCEMKCNEWMRALQRTILHLHESHEKGSHNSSSSLPFSNGIIAPTLPSNAPSAKLYELLRKDVSNRVCADCGATDPKWISINLGALLCIECAGLHRSLGVHVSKVRSLTMDSFDEETGEMLQQMGNTMTNCVLLACLPCCSSQVFPSPATPSCTREVREAWIKAKYVDKRFAFPSVKKSRTCTTLAEGVKNDECVGLVRSSSALDMHVGDGANGSESAEGVKFRESGVRNEDSEDENDERHSKGRGSIQVSCSLTAAAASGDLRSLLSSIISGTDLDSKVNGETALHIAVREGQTAATELLLLNGAKWSVVDDKENTPLHVAASEGKTLGVCQLLRRGADQSAINGEGATPLELAVDKVHADIVTIFRVHSMRDQFAEEFNNPMDETVSNVVSDITRKAGGRS